MDIIDLFEQAFDEQSDFMVMKHAKALSKQIEILSHQMRRIADKK